MIYKFDTSEFISLMVALAGLSVVVYSYFFRKTSKAQSNKLDKTSVYLLFLIVIFMVFNRVFTNVEALDYKPFFNLLEHLSSLIASIIALKLSLH